METSVTQAVPDTPSPKAPAEEATEFAVSRKDLLEELTQIQGVVDRRAGVPILSHILLQAAGNVLQLTATDLDNSLRSACPAAVKKPGVCAIPARKFFEYVKLLPDGEITIKTLENNWIQIRSGRSHTKMVALPRRNFPRLPLFPKESAMTLDADVLRNLIAKTIFAISKEESRYTLNGALLVLKPQSIAMVATDGHRLAQVEYQTSTTPSIQENEIRILIPHKALAELASLLMSSPVGSIQFAKDNTTLFFVIGSRLLTSRQLMGTFPNYEAVLPRDYANRVVLQREEFSLAIRRVAQFSDERSSAVRIRLGKDELKVSSSSVEIGESEDTVETAYSGDPLLMGFNSQYLLDFLKVAGSASVRFEFKNAQTAGELRPEEADPGNCTYRYVVMPLRV